MKNLLFILVLLLSLSGCSLFEKKGEIIAQVDKETLSMEEFKANFTEAEWKSLTAEQKKEYVQQWVNLILLAKEAKELGLGKDKQVKNKINYAEQKILGNALISSRLANEKISEEDLFNYYRIHQGDFSKPIMNYKVQRIFSTDLGLLSKVKQEIQNGMLFEDAAKVYSQEELGKSGGFMGMVTPEDADSTFWLAMRNLKALELTTLQKDNGFYLMRFISEEAGVNQAGFEGLKDEIRRRILDERRKQVYDDLLRELKSKSDVYLMI
jgi:peptidyl-prolyl cis-trans isomerase C